MMYPKYHILVLGLVLLGHSCQGKSYNEQTGHAAQPDSGRYYDDIYLDEQQFWVPADLDSSEEASGQEGSGFEGSADGPTSLCMQMRKQLQAHQEAYIPECTEDGEYQPLQCNEETSECWCVTQNGDRIPNTLRRDPHKPKCSRRGGPPHVKPGPGRPEGRPDDSVNNDDDISIDDNVIDEETHVDDNTNTNKINPIPEEKVEIGPPPEGNGDSTGLYESQARSLERSPIIAQPGILAGIIGGAVVGLLCAVLLVMFIVYRMRKKDEGSYALDEPKRSPSHGYQKARDREYFA